MNLEITRSRLQKSIVDMAFLLFILVSFQFVLFLFLKPAILSNDTMSSQLSLHQVNLRTAVGWMRLI